MASWHDLGPLTQFTRPVSTVQVGKVRLAVTSVGGRHGVISGVCNHTGGPLGEGRCEGEYLVCPWHGWKYHVRTGQGEPGYEVDAVPSYPVREEGGHLWVDLDGATRRSKGDHPPHPLARRVERAPGPVRVVGISTTNMDLKNPRYSTSEALLEVAMDHARELHAEARTIRLAELSFRACEGYYSKSARACTWPCSITQMDPDDQLDRVYEALVHWADVFLLATPIRWGAPSALYSKMVERLNCIQNQVTIANRVLLRDKVAAFIITGGQDNVQAVAGQMLGFFAELGLQFPQFPYIAHSRGWSAEDMENNERHVQQSTALHEGAAALVERCAAMACSLVELAEGPGALVRGGRKGMRIDG